MVRKIMENGILINYMDAQSWNSQVVTVIGGNSRMVMQKDMEQWSGLMEADTSGNGWIISSTGMEYTDGLVETYITESGNRILKMGKDTRGGQVAMSIGESSRMTCYGETESNKKRKFYTMPNTKKISSSAGVKYSEVLQPLSIN
jgi:hypothetical protein